MLKCGNKEYSRLNIQLSKMYIKLQALPEEGREILKLQQQAWLKFRKNYCDAYYKGSGTIVKLNVSGCYVKLTKRRINEFDKQYKEAKELGDL